ncbi:hypothetical protein PUR71_01430, partial [Streptomyces sp. SP17BM10]|uniref:hypothetical protein n=1 Tax=Streptomyces sp. SP17BM10 TaxID=3002530 RepID=UPI002E7797C9
MSVTSHHPPLGTLATTPNIGLLSQLAGRIDGVNPSVLVPVPAGLTADVLAAVLQAVLDHHDALRAR